jgi:phosphoribosylformylglycinamidine synthase
MVRTNSTVTSDGDSAIVRIKGTSKGLAVKTDCNARYVYLDPRVGAQIAVAESARNVVCVGAMPVAVTNCLNFGNPYDPEVYWQFKEAVLGIGDACRHFDTPVTGGNVSFYNESPESAVYPTPVIGMLGIIDDIEKAVRGKVASEGLDLVLIGRLSDDLSGSQYLTSKVGRPVGGCPEFDLTNERNVQLAVLESIGHGIVTAAHDVSDGGLAVCLAEMLMSSPELGLTVNLNSQTLGRMDGVLFGEAQSRVVLAAKPESVSQVEAIAKHRGVQSYRLGRVDRSGLLQTSDGSLRISLEEARGIYESAIPNLLAGEL